MESSRIVIEEYKKIIESQFFANGSVVAFIWNNDANWSVASVSQNVKNILGHQRELFLEQNLKYSELIHPDDLSNVLKEVKDAITNKLDFFIHKPYRILDGKGNYFWVKDSTNILYDAMQNITHFVGNIISIDDEIRSLQEQKTEFQTIFDTTKDGIAILDMKTNFIRVNKSYCQITGFTQEELLETSCFAMTYPEDIPNTLEKMKVLFDEGFVDSYEKRCIVKGKVITVSMSVSLLPNKKHMLVSMKDISQIKTFEAQAKMASMGEMIGNIAHQWRQPLSVITATASGIEVKQHFGLLDETTLSKSMESIIFQANYLSKTIDDFRNFTKETNEIQTISIQETLLKTLTIVKPTLIENHITLFSEIDEDLSIQGDENQLIQAFINIINNAKDAINENVIKEENRLIFLKTKKTNNKIEIFIKDSGGGIPENVIERVFEPYFTTKHQSIGTGIGLSMTYKIIVEKHHGKIEAKNLWYEYNKEHYKGAFFRIEFSEIERNN